nr:MULTISPECIES: hypothetical protein [Methylomicrobium]
MIELIIAVAIIWYPGIDRLSHLYGACQASQR